MWALVGSSPLFHASACRIAVGCHVLVVCALVLGLLVTPRRQSECAGFVPCPRCASCCTPSLVFRQTPVEGAPPHPCEGVRGSAPLSPQVTRPPLPRLYQPHDPPRHACSRSRWARSCRRVDESCCRAAALVSSTRPPGELCPCLDVHASPCFLRTDPARLTGLPCALRFTPICHVAQ